MTNPRLLSVATATPPETYTQDDVLDRLNLTNPRIRSIFRNSHIDTRSFYFLDDEGHGVIRTETQGELLRRHLAGALEIGGNAVQLALNRAGLDLADIDYLCCVTTTGFLCPGLSAHLIAKLGISADTSRVDVVGMGCNAGLNALNAVTAWAARNPGKFAVQLCVEICSAAYVSDDTLRTAVVNSLFGDGAAAVVVGTDVPDAHPGVGPLPQVVDFASEILTSEMGAMRFDWDDAAGKFSFYLDPAIPYVVGANAPRPVRRLLDRHDLRTDQIDHWVAHTGGKKVIDALKYNLDLVDYDLRHTRAVLSDHGNVSSGSFLFSYERLVEEKVVHEGDLGMMLTMGPGTTIEAGLLTW
jgi:polyketide synthase Type III